MGDRAGVPLRAVAIVVCLALVCGAAPARASVALVPPVDGPVIVRFDEPEHAYAPGHRGIDYAVPPGTRVRAAAAGTVAFAGRVGGALAVSIHHGFGLSTTYSALGSIEVRAGDEVGAGAWIGTTGRAHPNGLDGLHLGVKLNGEYIDPTSLMRASDTSGAIHLAPLVWQPSREMPEAFRSAFADAGVAAQLCRDAVPLGSVPDRAPNDNIAVAVAGLGSSTAGGIRADMYEHGPEELGYAPGHVYRFSYAGTRGPGLHRPYEASDTYGDINAAARKLEQLLVRIGRRHPGADVDLIAHSMGGLVARRFLAGLAKTSAARLPRIDHLVTFSTPHKGSALAELPHKLDEGTLTGRWLVDGLSHVSRAGLAVPDPRSTAVGQLAPGSSLLQGLARESVVYGTKALALAMPNDAIVTADRATWDEARGRVVPPEGIQGHSAIVASDVAQGTAFAFLRDAPASCETGWDLWGPRIGAAVGFAESQSYRGLAALEEATVGRVVRVARLGRKLAGTRWGRVALKASGKLIHRTAVRLVNRERKEPPPPGGMGG